MNPRFPAVHDRKLKFCFGESAQTNRVTNAELTWPQFISHFRDPPVGDETGPEYLELPAAEQLRLKDCGYFMPCHMDKGIRGKGNVHLRSCLVMDVDHAVQGAIECVLDELSGLGQFKFIIATTRKHRPDAPRFRLIFPLVRDVSAIEYAAISRWLAGDIVTEDGKSSINWFDESGFEFTRVAFFPSVSKGEEYRVIESDGLWVDPDQILAKYVDPNDVSSWPVSEKLKDTLRLAGKRSGDPLTKPGIIGAFNRCYSIHQAMDEFIPGVYVSGAHDDRMTYAAGSSANGALIYDNGLFLFSRHETDPCYYQNCNAFDMVRIHLFGDLDSKVPADTPITQLPSHVKMLALAANDKAVAAEYRSSRAESHANDFDEFEVADKEAQAEIAAARYAGKFGCELKDARALFGTLSEANAIDASFMLEPIDAETPISASAILKRPDEWHGKRFLDPLYADIENDASYGRLNCKTGSRACLQLPDGRRYYLQPERELIKVKSGELSTATDQALRVIQSRGELFEYGPCNVARVVEGQLLTVTPIYLCDYLGTICRFQRYDERGKCWLNKDTPAKLPEFILERHGQRELQKLDSVITAPILRCDGSLLNTPGYDSASRLFYYSQELEAQQIPIEPNIHEAQAAFDFLWRPFRLFEFVNDESRGVMLAAILTAVLRPALPTAPGIGFDAPTIGSGKTLLAKTLAALAGVNFSAIAPPDDDAEMEKRLFSALREGARVVCLDNITAPIDGKRSPALCAFMTAPVFKGRILGKSETPELPNRALLVLTGNNLRTHADMVRRVLIARVDARSETPYGRRFEFDPEAMIRADRIQYVCAALTLVRAAITHGDVFNLLGLGTPLPGSTASYEGWDALVRQPVGWIAQTLQVPSSFGDPTAGVARAAASDPYREVLARMLSAWRRCFGVVPIRVAAAWKAAHEAGDFNSCEDRVDLREAIDGVAGGDRGFTVLRLSRWIERHAEEIANGLRFENSYNKAEKVNEWRVVEMQP